MAPERFLGLYPPRRSFRKFVASVWTVGMGLMVGGREFVSGQKLPGRWISSEFGDNSDAMYGTYSECFG